MLGMSDDCVFMDYTYGYDGNGNRTEKTGNIYDGNGQRQESVTFRYDQKNQLLEECYGGDVSRYQYDPAGNRISQEYNGQKTVLTYNQKNQLLSRKTEGVASFYTYDKQGSLIEERVDDKIRKYHYDSLNRQQEVILPDGDFQRNRYDAEGLRAEMEENGRLCWFLFHQGEIVGELGKGDVLRSRYIRGHGVEYIEQEQKQLEVLKDEQKSTVFLLDEDHELMGAYAYDGFGNLRTNYGNVDNRILYTGQQYDSLSGQYYLRARYYSPQLGRFLQEDTFHGDGLNLYAYCANNAVNYYDPSGYAKTCNEVNWSDGQVDPKDVHFMQDSIRNQTGDFTVLGNAKALKNGTLSPNDFPNIKIWKDDNGKLWTLDHRRLASYRLAGIDSIPFNWASSNEVRNQMWKMTTTTGGETIRLKINNSTSKTIY